MKIIIVRIMRQLMDGIFFLSEKFGANFIVIRYDPNWKSQLKYCSYTLYPRLLIFLVTSIITRKVGISNLNITVAMWWNINYASDLSDKKEHLLSIKCLIFWSLEVWCEVWLKIGKERMGSEQLYTKTCEQYSKMKDWTLNIDQNGKEKLSHQNWQPIIEIES